MKSKTYIKELLEDFQKMEGRPLHVDEDAIATVYQKENESQSLAIKILSIFGGILACCAFFGFFLIAGLYNSDYGLLLFGAICIIASIWVNKKHDKIIIDTVSISSFITGFILIGISLLELNMSENIICLIFILMALMSIRIAQNYIMSFLSVLIINGSLIALIILNQNYELLHLYISSLALALAYFFLNEAKLITTNKAITKLYNPIRIGLIFSFLIGLVLLSQNDLFPISARYIWISALVIVAIIVFIVSKLFTILKINSRPYKISIYTFTIVCLLPTIFSPAISGAILIILLSFMVNYKTGFVVGICSFIFFISKYYYDLNFTLLTKSILLFITGILFISLYLFTYKKLTAHEKV